MLLLLDIGNTHTHLGLANTRRVVKQANLPTAGWLDGTAEERVAAFARAVSLEGAAVCSVVPRATPRARRAVKDRWGLSCLELTPATLRGVGLDYPKPHTIGPDRLANAVAARHCFGAPSIVVDFGTAVTFDVVDRAGQLRRRHYRARPIADDRLSAREDRPAAAHPHSRDPDRRSARAPSRPCWWGRSRLSRPDSRTDYAELKRELKASVCRWSPRAATRSSSPPDCRRLRRWTRC